MTHENSTQPRDDQLNDSTDSYKHYGSFSPTQLVRHAWNGIRNDARSEVSIIRGRLDRDTARIEGELGRDLESQKVLVVGPGQVMNEARFLAHNNDVTGLDIDVIPRGFNPMPYFQMLKQNGIGRVVKTIARKLLGLDRKWEKAWCRELDVRQHAMPSLVLGDICEGPPQEEAYDLVGSWAVFQHLPNPEVALENMVKALKPGGVLYVGIHLYTSFSGHCDYRAISGTGEKLPIWGHLRPSTQHLIRPSAYLNRRRLIDWREMFNRLTPGFEEFLESYPDGPEPPPEEIREELKDYDDEELYTVDVFYCWKKPIAATADLEADREKAPEKEQQAEVGAMASSAIGSDVLEAPATDLDDAAAKVENPHERSR